MVQFGIIGIGMQGSGLLKTAVALPGTKCVAACDLWDGRQTLAKEIVGSNIATTRKYQELLANPDIQALIIAVPDHWHKQIVVDAMAAGKDVYCEKPMSHSVADGAAMVAAAKKSGRIVQIGSQRTSSSLLAKAKQVYDSGAIGELACVELSLGRNDPTGAWEYPPPPGHPRELRLGHLARHRAQEALRPHYVRPLALLEGIRHRRRRRSHGTSR